MTRDEVLAVIEKAKWENWEELWLTDKSLTEFPIEITELTSLKRLNLSYNQIKEIPFEISNLKSLERLDLYENQLQTLSYSICNLENLTFLDLFGNKIKEVSTKISKLKKLEFLGLSVNKLENIPTEIFQLNNLKILHLSKNALTKLPVNISNLSKLEVLNLSDNNIEEIPIEVYSLKNLEGIFLHNNKIKYISSEISKLVNLKRIFLDNNKISFIPVEISKLENLTGIGLLNNPIKSIPDEFSQLKNLLLITFLGELPEKICLIQQANGIYVPPYAPPLPDEILQRDSRKIHAYLYGILIDQKERPLNEAKLVLVGEGAVGKTSLVKRLISNDFDEKEIKTEGISRNLWRLPIGEIKNKWEGILKDIIRVNVWDFGGQEIMHSTHQFFLTKRSIYILVLDARRGEQESRLEYWLKLAHSFGGSSPIIVAINKSDEHSLDLNQPFLKNKYPSIQAFCTISCKTGSGITELKEKITAQISSLKDVKTPLPQTWFELKGELETLIDNYINQGRYEQLCEKYQIMEKDNQKTLLSLLHDLGIVLNFQDDDRFDRLKETNVLNPAWVTEGVYKIINNNTLFQNKGKLQLSDLNDILDKQNYPSKKEHQFIMDMMQKFELCFPFEENKTYLIPELLQKSEPDLNWDSENSLAFQYHYDVLPQSVISRFIVRMNQYISKQTYWRTGVVLTYQNDSNKALIKADIEDKKVFIWVNGNQTTRREFLAIIRRDFEHIHSTIKGLKVDEKIPYKSALIDYQDLIDLEQMGEEYHMIPSLKEKVNVKQLLAGLESERKEVKKTEENKPPKVENKKDDEKDDKTDYQQWLFAAIFALISGFALIFLIGSFYYGVETKENLTLLKETFSPFAQTYNELTNSESEK